jgi:hypothetical protein
LLIRPLFSLSELILSAFREGTATLRSFQHPPKFSLSENFYGLDTQARWLLAAAFSLALVSTKIFLVGKFLRFRYSSSLAACRSLFARFSIHQNFPCRKIFTV